ncbi:hypothetical protein HY387_00350 [Candidatus Daviesbacteria bacterium]|nr:hypothetical protein [Candidatus Daviesbacteria bacterium]
MTETLRDHYSNKGGHKERSKFWKGVNRLAGRLPDTMVYSPRRLVVVPLPLTVEQAHIIKRDMPRFPRDGRR